jgi:hypothetical protein
VIRAIVSPERVGHGSLLRNYGGLAVSDGLVYCKPLSHSVFDSEESVANQMCYHLDVIQKSREQIAYLSKTLR